VWGFPLLLRLSDRIKGMLEREKIMVNLVTCAIGLLLICTRSATGTHNQELIDAPDQGTRQNGSGTQFHTVGVRVGVTNKWLDKMQKGKQLLA
jgi:hypothetical protein